MNVKLRSLLLFLGSMHILFLCGMDITETISLPPIAVITSIHRYCDGRFDVCIGNNFNNLYDFSKLGLTVKKAQDIKVLCFTSKYDLESKPLIRLSFKAAIDLCIEKEYVNIFQRLGYQQAEILGKDLIEASFRSLGPCFQQPFRLTLDVRQRDQPPLVRFNRLPTGRQDGIEQTLLDRRDV